MGSRAADPVSEARLRAFARPEVWGLVLPNMLARLSSATCGLALLLTVRVGTGSFAAAGLTVGSFGAANVLSAPFRGRMVERVGLRGGLRACAAIYGLGLLLTATFAVLRVYPAIVVGSGALVGLFPPPHGSVMRTLWRELCSSDADLTRAFGIDATAEEILFVSGPPLVMLVMTLTSPAAGLVLTAAVCVIGTVIMTRRPSCAVTVPATRTAEGGRRESCGCQACVRFW